MRQRRRRARRPTGGTNPLLSPAGLAARRRSGLFFQTSASGCGGWAANVGPPAAPVRLVQLVRLAGPNADTGRTGSGTVNLSGPPGPALPVRLPPGQVLVQDGADGGCGRAGRVGV
jgi:hypothetical protein